MLLLGLCWRGPCTHGTQTMRPSAGPDTSPWTRHPPAPHVHAWMQCRSVVVAGALEPQARAHAARGLSPRSHPVPTRSEFRRVVLYSGQVQVVVSPLSVLIHAVQPPHGAGVGVSIGPPVWGTGQKGPDLHTRPEQTFLGDEGGTKGDGPGQWTLTSTHHPERSIRKDGYLGQQGPQLARDPTKTPGSLLPTALGNLQELPSPGPRGRDWVTALRPPLA